MSTSSSPSISINYASFLGIHSVAAAVLFTLLFAPFIPLFIWRMISRFNFVYVFLTVFCLVRVVAFAIRAVLAGSSSAAENLNLLIADLVLSGAGFTGLLFSAFSLQSDRERLAGLRYNGNPIFALLTNQRVVHLLITGSVVMTIVGTIKFTSVSADERDLGNTLRTVGTVLILVLALVALIRALLFIHHQISGNRSAVNKAPSFGDKHSGVILGVIAVLLVIRMIYSVATVRKGQSEATWYPVSTLPEFLCVCMFAIPGLVIPRSELEEKDIEMNGYYNRPVGAPTVV